MGFYNVQDGDVPYFTALAHQYSMSDNYHQAINGGTGANHIAIGYGETIFFAKPNGRPGTHPRIRLKTPIRSPELTTFTPKTATAVALT